MTYERCVAAVLKVAQISNLPPGRDRTSLTMKRRDCALGPDGRHTDAVSPPLPTLKIHLHDRLDLVPSSHALPHMDCLPTVYFGVFACTHL